MKRFLFPILFIIMPALLIAESQEQFRVGAILALSGPISIVGVPMKNAMVLAKEKFDTDNRLKILFEDDGFLPRNTVSAAKKLINEDKVQALIVFGTNQGSSIVDFTERQKIPFISLNVNRRVVKNRKFSVLFMPSVEDLTEVNIKQIKHRGYRTIATTASMQDACLLQKDIIEKSGAAEVVGSYEFEPTERAFREIAARIVKANPDAVFVSTIAPQGALLTKRLREFGYQGEFFVSLQTARLAELKASNGALENAWAVSGDDRESLDYRKLYRNKFGSEPSELSIYAYDSIKMIVEGLSRGELNNYLHTVKNFTGIAGTYSADGNNGFTFKVASKQFTSDGFRYVDLD